jgi:hypothetical protein
LLLLENSRGFNQIKGNSQMTRKKTANELVHDHFVTHTTTTTNVDLGSSDGIRKTIEACVSAIKALADHIDGIYTDEDVAPEARVVSPEVRTSTDPLTGATVYTDVATGKRTDKDGKVL